MKLPSSIRSKLITDTATYVTNYGKRPSSSNISKIREMLTLDGVTGLAYESLCLMVTGLIGEYRNSDETVQDGILDMLKNLDSQSTIGMGQSMIEIWLNSCAFMPYGFQFGVPIYEIKKTGSRLKEVVFLEQELTQFEGTKRQIQNAIYQGNTSYKIPYVQGYHLINQSNITPGNNPYGVRLGDRALPDWEAYKIMQQSYVVVAQKQATKLLWAKTDTSGQVMTGGTEAEPVYTPNNVLMQRALEGAANSDALVIDTEDEVGAVDHTTDGQFFLEGFHLLDSRRFRNFYHAPTMFSASLSGVGQSNLSDVQQQNTLRMADGKAVYITQTFVKHVLRPLIIYLYGEQPDYGYFEILSQDPKALEYGELYSKMLDALGRLLGNEAIQGEALTQLLAELQAIMNALKNVLKIEQLPKK